MEKSSLTAISPYSINMQHPEHARHTAPNALVLSPVLRQICLGEKAEAFVGVGMVWFQARPARHHLAVSAFHACDGFQAIREIAYIHASQGTSGQVDAP